MIYLDNSATTKPYQEVIQSFAKVSEAYWGNPSSLHGLGTQAEQLLMKAREQAAELLKVRNDEIVFTSGGSESNNLAIKGIAEQYKNRGNHLITTTVEHPSVKNPFLQLQKSGFEITFLPVDSQGRVQLEDVKNAMRETTILVSIMHVNNEVGSIQPIQEIGELVAQYPKSFFHVDGVQGYGKVDLDLKAAHVDLYSLSGHKFHGLKGTGLLYVRNGVRLASLIAGGSQESGLRSGTVSVAGAVSLAKAMRMAAMESKKGISQMNEYRSYLMGELQEVEGVYVNSPLADCAPHILNFSIPGMKSETFVHTLEDKDIYVSTTSACSSKKKALSSTLLEMGKSEQIASSSIRISLDYHHDMDDLQKVVYAIQEAINMLREVNKK